MKRMFQGARSFNQPLSAEAGVRGWDVLQVESFRSMFASCAALNVAFRWSMPSATSLVDMFASASSLNSELEFRNTIRVNDVSGMFYRATALRRTVRLDMSGVRLAQAMFDECPDEAMVDASSTDRAAIPALRRQLGSRLLVYGMRKRVRDRTLKI